MAKLVLDGGTDVAGMVLFDVDALVRDRRPDSESARRLEKQRSALCLPTGADGAYLLHAYIDEPIPPHLLKYCVADDSKSTILNISSGNIGFGGLESLYANFKANESIRTDAKIAAGSYDVTAHHTDYPENLIEDAVRSRIGARGMRIQKMPGYIVLVAVVATIAARYASGWLAAVCAAAVAAAMLLIFWRHPLVARLSRESNEVQSGVSQHRRAHAISQRVGGRGYCAAEMNRKDGSPVRRFSRTVKGGFPSNEAALADVDARTDAPLEITGTFRATIRS